MKLNATLYMRLVACLAIGAVICGCGVSTSQPESAKTVAAFEIPLQSEADRTQFLSVLSAAAEANGMHVDAASSQELKQQAEAIPAIEMTVHAAVWRGSNDDEPVAVAMDQQDHLGQVWIMSLKGKDEALTTRFRERVMREITRRWPGTLPLPIMPTGGIPLHGDLIRTPNGYIVKPSEAHKYDLHIQSRTP